MSETYEAVAQFAQSWGLLYFFLVFVAVVVFVMRPSASAATRRPHACRFARMTDDGRRSTTSRRRPGHRHRHDRP